MVTRKTDAPAATESADGRPSRRATPSPVAAKARKGGVANGRPTAGSDRPVSLDSRADDPPNRGSSRQTVQSVEVGAEMLKALARLGPAASLTDLSDAAGMVPAKAHRYLQAMIASGLAAQERQSGRYTLGPEAIRIGMAALAQIDVVGTISDMLPALRDRTGLTCFLAVWGSHGATVVRVMESIGEVTILTRVGAIMPLLRSATGLLFAAWISEQARNAMAAAEPEALRDQLAQADSALHARLALIRATGVSVVQGLMVPGIDAMAVPIFDARGEIAAVVTLVGTDNSFDLSADGTLARDLQRFGETASLTLGAAPGRTQTPPAPLRL